jgi:hypothetical protein
LISEEEWTKYYTDISQKDAVDLNNIWQELGKQAIAYEEQEDIINRMNRKSE